MKTSLLLLASAGLASAGDKKQNTTSFWVDLKDSAGKMCVTPKNADGTEKNADAVCLSQNKAEEIGTDGKATNNAWNLAGDGAWGALSEVNGLLSATFTATDGKTGKTFGLDVFFTSNGAARTTSTNVLCDPATCTSNSTGGCRNGSPTGLCNNNINGTDQCTDAGFTRCSQEVNVRADSLEFNVRFRNWNFANNNNTLSYGVDIDPPKGKQDKKNAGNAATYELQLEGATISSSTSAYVDGTVQNIGNPVSAPKGSNQLTLTWAFPHFNNELSLDPSLSLSSPASWIVPSIGLVGALVALF